VFAVQTLFLGFLSFKGVNNITLVTSMETDHYNNKGNVMTKMMNKKYEHRDYANFEFTSHTFNENRIYTFMYNRYAELEIYTTGKLALSYASNSTFVRYHI
jgi:hypothetical protein